jgi:hypothetical protein
MKKTIIFAAALLAFANASNAQSTGQQKSAPRESVSTNNSKNTSSSASASAGSTAPSSNSNYTGQATSPRTSTVNMPSYSKPATGEQKSAPPAAVSDRRVKAHAAE